MGLNPLSFQKKGDLTMTMNASCFRAYDIRGRVDVDFNEIGVYRLGIALAKKIRSSFGADSLTETPNKTTPIKVVVGYDGRLSSPRLERALVLGLESEAITVIRVGCGPTPLLYYASHHCKAHGGVMITGSHNPPEYNGFKVVIDQKALSGNEIASLFDIMNNDSQESCFKSVDRDVSFPSQEPQAVINGDIHNEYVKALVADFDTHYQNKTASDKNDSVEKGGISETNACEHIRVAWDPGNGAMGDVLQDVLSQIQGEHFVINGEVDGTFPAHHPDPTVPENMEQLAELVTMMDCDYGIAFDGDGDRIGVVDRQGRLLSGDQLLMLFASEVLANSPNAHIVADVKTSQSVFDFIAEKGGRPCLWKTGHSWIKQKMRAENSLLGGEMSGHIFFADRYFGYDDALYAALRFMGIVSTLPQSFEDWYEGLPKLWNTPELKIPMQGQDFDKFQLVENLKNVLTEKNIGFLDIDGVRVSHINESENGWWLVRASNTEDHVVARAEASSQEQLDEILDDMELYLKTAGLKDTA